MKKEREGYEWVQSKDHGGYWKSTKIRKGVDPLHCPGCGIMPNGLSKTTSQDFYLYGVCTHCVSHWVDGDNSFKRLRNDKQKIIKKIKRKRNKMRKYIQSQSCDNEIKDMQIKNMRLDR